MIRRPSLFRFLFFSFGILIFLSCTGNKQVEFPVRGAGAPLLAQSRKAREGLLDFSRPQKLDYLFDDSLALAPGLSLEIEYDFSIPPSQSIKERYSLALNTGGSSWELPMDLSFLGIGGENVIHYSVPIKNSFSGRFSIALEPNEKAQKNDSQEAPVFRIRSVRFREKWLGFYHELDDHFFTGPFAYRRDDGAFVIEIPASFGSHPGAEIEAVVPSGRAALEIAGRKFETFAGVDTIRIPAMFPAVDRAVLSGDGIESFRLSFPAPPVFPEPISADPGLVLEWPVENRRNSNFELFRWDRFPSLLIFDTADYAVQERLLKRLAFFVEKAGFRGRLASDREIAALHGWNAHDYRAEDLARFFDIARTTNFPLLDEERELERILLKEGIIRESSAGIAAGRGGIISISRESPDYLRYRFMTHEGFHGLFFIDEDFRNFSRSRWERLPVTAKRFIISFFEYQQYDTKDEYLLINEFMAHILQQPVSQAADYFGRNLPQRLESSWRSTVLPEKNEASGTWPALAAAFTAEAQAFSAYVNQRWGLAAGRVWNLRVRQE